MDETTNGLGRSDSTLGTGAYDVAEGTDVPITETEDAEVAFQRAQIERTRAEMSETVDALKEKLSPSNLMDEAKESVREATIGRAEDAISGAAASARGFLQEAETTARGTGMTMIETIKENPIPAALIGIGAGWLMMNARKTHEGGSWSGRSSDNYARDSYSGSLGGSASTGAYSGTYTSGSYGADASSTGVGDSLGRTVEGVQSRAGEMASQVRDRASDMAQNVQQSASQLGEQARESTRDMQQGFQQMLRENPLGVSAIALALGAAAGFAVPETRAERQWMGEARDTLVERAGQVAQDVAGKAEDVAQQAINAASDTAQRAARDQGLTAQ